MVFRDEGVMVAGAEARARDSPAPGVRRLLIVYSPMLAVAVVWCVAHAVGYRGLMVLGWLPGAVAMSCSAWYLYQASRATRLSPTGRRFWRRLAVAAALIAPSTYPLTEASLGGRRSGPVLAAAACLLVGSVLLVLWALLRLPVRSRGRGDRLRLGLDATTVLVCAATFLWHYVLEPLITVGAELYTVLGLLAVSLVCLL